VNVIIAGCRGYEKYETVVEAVAASGFDITEVVCGCARGVDTLGERWANENNIPVARHPADWNTFGRKAGPVRNQQMANYGDALIAVWDGKSRGTKNMIQCMERQDKPVYVTYI
jgi:hypothetical protein